VGQPQADPAATARDVEHFTLGHVLECFLDESHFRVVLSKVPLLIALSRFHRVSNASGVGGLQEIGIVIGHKLIRHFVKEVALMNDGKPGCPMTVLSCRASSF
jgi:hypothetical protein